MKRSGSILCVDSDLVTEQIDFKLYEAIEHILESVHGLRDKYIDSSYKCPSGSSYGANGSFDCGSLFYGVRTRTTYLWKQHPVNPATGTLEVQISESLSWLKFDA